jgi:hypothetical protein
MHRRQRGAALYVVLILMLVLAWFAISTSRISGQQLQLVGNSQAEHQGIVAAQRAIDSTISSNEFSKDPTGVAGIPIETDVDADGSIDFTAKLEPKPNCIRVRPIKTMELDVSKEGDRVCLQSSGASGNPDHDTGRGGRGRRLAVRGERMGRRRGGGGSQDQDRL